MILRKQRELIVDGECVRTYALRDFLATITTDWWSHVTDGDLAVDISMEVRPDACRCAGAMLLVSRVAPEASGYVTGAPVTQWLGLATLDGCDAIQLGDGCANVVPGVNVVRHDGGELEVVDPIEGVAPDTCPVLEQVHISDVPCATSPSASSQASPSASSQASPSASSLAR